MYESEPRTIKLDNVSIALYYDPVYQALKNKNKVDYEKYRLFLESLKYEIGKDLISLKKIKVQLYPHQVETAYKAINFMNVRALLADEVGLGKTVEAGIIIKELLIRKRVNNVLVLTPANLTLQWQGELQSKFEEEFELVQELQNWNGNKLICSIDLAKRPEHKIRALSIPWDLLVVDEAHKLKNPETQNFRLVEELSKRYILLLTATPLQNNLVELYNLINILRPGMLGTRKQFEENYIGSQETLKNVNRLKEYIEPVIIRNRRVDTIIQFPERVTENILIEPTKEERELYNAVTDYVITSYWRGYDLFRLISLQRSVTSSSYAIKKSLWNYLDKTEDLNDRRKLLSMYAQASAIRESSKQRLVLKSVEKIKRKMLLFTTFLATQESLHEIFTTAGYNVADYNGSMSREEKRESLKKFEDEADILISTDAGSEGLNLQHCDVVLNYDLPWNPMVLEQRIGRVHRIGQKSNVLVLNFTLKDTVEEYIFEVLAKKVNIFETVVGEMDLILSNIQTEKSFEVQILEILTKSRTRAMLSENFKKWGNEIEEAKNLYEKIKSFNEEVFKNFDLSALRGSADEQNN